MSKVLSSEDSEQMEYMEKINNVIKIEGGLLEAYISFINNSELTCENPIEVKFVWEKYGLEDDDHHRTFIDLINELSENERLDLINRRPDFMDNMNLLEYYTRHIITIERIICRNMRIVYDPSVFKDLIEGDHYYNDISKLYT